MRKIGFLAGFGAGYVLGAKAGTERYEQLRRLYDNLISSKGFQEATGKAKDAAATGFEQVKDKASEIKERKADPHPSGLSVAPPPN